MVRCRLVIRHDEHRARIAKFPQMRILVYFFPRETRITAEEGVTLCVGGESLANVPDRHQEPGNRWSAIRRAGVPPLRVAVDVQRTGLDKGCEG